jgi:adenylate cyclase
LWRLFKSLLTPKKFRYYVASAFAGSFVIARSTAFTYRAAPIDVKQIGRELRVRYVLEGSVRRTRDQVQVNGS